MDSNPPYCYERLSTDASGADAAKKAVGTHAVKLGVSRMDMLLRLRPATLEKQFWAAHTQRAAVVDAVYSVSTLAFWFTFVLTKRHLSTPLMGYALATLLLSHAATIAVARRFYMRHRHVLLPVVLAATTVVMHYNRKGNTPDAIAAYLATGGGGVLGSLQGVLKLLHTIGLMTQIVAAVAAVLPLRVQLPLLLLGTALSIRGRTLATAQALMDTPALLDQLNRHVSYLDNAVRALFDLIMPLGACLDDMKSPLLLRPAQSLLQPSPAVDPVSALLALQLYAGLLLPLYYRWCLEAHYKTRFLQRLRIANNGEHTSQHIIAWVGMHGTWVVLLALLAAISAQLLQRPLMWLAG